MQGNQFTTNFFLLPLGGCDVVVGMQWLQTLGPVLWNFKKLTMSFQVDSKTVKLKGMTSSKSQLVEAVQICQLTTIEWKGFFLQIVQQQSSNVKEEIDEELE